MEEIQKDTERDALRTNMQRICPNCKSKATKLYDMNTGHYLCQACGCIYIWEDLRK